MFQIVYPSLRNYPPQGHCPCFKIKECLRCAFVCPQYASLYKKYKRSIEVEEVEVEEEVTDDVAVADSSSGTAGAEGNFHNVCTCSDVISRGQNAQPLEILIEEQFSLHKWTQCI